MSVAISKVPDWTACADDAGDGCLGREVPEAGEAPGGPAGDWPVRFARMLTEALAGSRPANQILPWTSKRARSQFDRLLRGFRGAGSGQSRVLRVLTTRPAQDVIEMSVIAGFGVRTRALALRLERGTGQHSGAVNDVSDGWVCTDIEAA